MQSLARQPFRSSGTRLLLAICCVLTAGSSAAATFTANDLGTAEAFVDAFYSWDDHALAATVEQASADAARVLYYQAWAEAGNYRIQRRRPCAFAADGRIECAVTVTDDIGGALGYVATDTFQLAVESGRIVGVEFISDDPPVLNALFDWLSKERPEVFEGPCKDLFDGGTTPAACVRAMVQGARDFSAIAHP